MPGSIYVSVEVLLGGLAGADAIARVVVGEDVTVDPGPQADVEAAHLAQVYSITVGEQHCEPGRGRRSTKGMRAVRSGDALVLGRLFLT